MGVWHLHRWPAVTWEECHRAGASLWVSGLRSGKSGEGSAECRRDYAQCAQCRACEPASLPGQGGQVEECGQAGFKTAKQFWQMPLLAVSGIAPVTSLSTPEAKLLGFAKLLLVASGDFPFVPPPPWVAQSLAAAIPAFPKPPSQPPLFPCPSQNQVTLHL